MLSLLEQSSNLLLPFILNVNPSSNSIRKKVYPPFPSYLKYLIPGTVFINNSNK